MAEDASSLETSAEALVSLKEGKGNIFNSTPTKRGNRIRKPNPRIFGDDEDERGYLPKPRKQPKVSSHSGSTPRATLLFPDKKVAQDTGVRLRNLLKLPKAHKWVCYEWFYANIDMPLFQGENDFCSCLRESFPNLKTKRLRRAEWSKIRRLMGKPRRCSAAFFAEERAVLQAKRLKIRMLQQNKLIESAELKDLPEEIPMPLHIGTKVTARLRKPQDGLFTGVVDAINSVDNTYRITFDRSGLGTHSIPDYEVLSNEPQELMPLMSFSASAKRTHRPVFSPPRYNQGVGSPPLSNDPLLGGSPLKTQSLSLENGTYGGFPIKFLVLVTRLHKILAAKKERVNDLKDMNAEAEKQKSYCQPMSDHFQQKYATAVLDLERLNKDLNEYLIGVQQFCQQQVVPEQGPSVLEPAAELREKSDDDATDLVRRVNLTQGRKMVKSDKMMELITKLTSLLIQVKMFSETDAHSFEFKSVQDALSDIKSSLNPGNVSCFQNNVEIHINHIQSGLTQLGNLHAFSTSSSVPL